MLVIDDDADHAFLATRVIVKHDPRIDVEICPTGADALRILGLANGHAPDAIFIDIGLGAENGLDLIARIRHVEGCARTPIAVLTAAMTDDARIEALLHDASAYICKPLTAERVKDLLGDSGFHWDMRDLPEDLDRYHRLRRERNLDGSGPD
ncbi:MAG: DNA-binding response OmpR family regulator [Paracoccaceae bacterium]|jgi:DNA-binding response OmpR family regulator